MTIISGPGRPGTVRRPLGLTVLCLAALLVAIPAGQARAVGQSSDRNRALSGASSVLVSRIAASPNPCGSPGLNVSSHFGLYSNATACLSADSGSVLTLSGSFDGVEDSGILIKVEVLNEKLDAVIGSSLCKTPPTELSILQGSNLMICQTTSDLPVGPTRLNISLQVVGVPGVVHLGVGGLLSLCEPGEYPAGSSSSSSLFCAPCPVGGSCLGGLEEPVSLQGYWPTIPSQWQSRGINIFSYPGPYYPPYLDGAVGSTTAVPPFVACPLGAVCEAGQGMEGKCYEGYSQGSWACTECQDNWAKRGTGLCGPCPPARISGVILAGAAIGAIIFMIYIIISAMNRRSKIVIIARLLINYLQQTSIVRAFSAFSGGPAQLQQAIYLANGANVISFDVQALNCAFKATFYTRLGLYIALPVFCAAVPWLVLKTYSSAGIKCRSIGCRPLRERKVNRTALTATLVLFYFFHQQVCAAILGVFSCASVVAGGFLRADPGVSCFTDTHKAVQTALAPIFLIIYGLGIPVFIFYVLHKHRKVLASRRSLKYLGSLYDGTRKAVSVWYEPQIMLRKLAFLILSAVIVDNTLQLLAAQLLISIVLGAQLYARPYEERLLNGLEAFSLIGNLTLYFGLLTFSIAGSSGYTGLQSAMTYLILVVNGLVLVAFLLSFFLALRQQAVIAAREAAALAMRGISTNQAGLMAIENGGAGGLIKGVGGIKGVAGANGSGTGKASWMAQLFGIGQSGAAGQGGADGLPSPGGRDASLTRSTMAYISQKTRQASNIVRFMVMGAGGVNNRNGGGMVGASGIVGTGSGRGGSSVPQWGRGASSGASGRRRGTTRVGLVDINDFDSNGNNNAGAEDEEGPSPQMVTRTLAGAKAAGNGAEAANGAFGLATMSAGVGQQQQSARNGGPGGAAKRAQRQIRHSRLVVAHERLQAQQRRLLTLVVPRSEVERARLLAVEAQLESSSAPNAPGGGSAPPGPPPSNQKPPSAGGALRTASSAAMIQPGSGGRTSPSVGGKRGSNAISALRRISEHFLGADRERRASAASASAAGARKGSILHQSLSAENPLSVTQGGAASPTSGSAQRDERWSLHSGLSQAASSRWSDRSLGEGTGAPGSLRRSSTPFTAATGAVSLDESILDENGYLRKSTRLHASSSSASPPPPPRRPASSSSASRPPIRAETNEGQAEDRWFVDGRKAADEDGFEDGEMDGDDDDDGADDVFIGRRPSLGKELADLLPTGSGIRKRKGGPGEGVDRRGIAASSARDAQPSSRSGASNARSRNVDGDKVLLVSVTAEKIAKQRQRALLAAELVGDTSKKGVQRMFQAAGGHTFISKVTNKVVRSIGIQADLAADRDTDGVLAAFAAQGKLSLATPGPDFGGAFGESDDSESDGWGDEEDSEDDKSSSNRNKLKTAPSAPKGGISSRPKRLTAASDGTEYSTATYLYSDGGHDRDDLYKGIGGDNTVIEGGGSGRSAGGARQIFTATSIRDFMALVRAARRTSEDPNATTSNPFARGSSSSNRRSISMGHLRSSIGGSGSSSSQRGGNSAPRTSSLVFDVDQGGQFTNIRASSSSSASASSRALRISSLVENGRGSSAASSSGLTGIELSSMRGGHGREGSSAPNAPGLSAVNQRGMRVFLLTGGASQRALDVSGDESKQDGEARSPPAEDGAGAAASHSPQPSLPSPSPALLMSAIKEAQTGEPFAKRSSVRFLDVLEQTANASSRRLNIGAADAVAIDMASRPPLVAFAASSEESVASESVASESEDAHSPNSGKSDSRPTSFRREGRPTRKFTHNAVLSPFSQVPMDVLRARSRASTAAPLASEDSRSRMSVQSVNLAQGGTERMSLRPVLAAADPVTGLLNPLSRLAPEPAPPAPAPAKRKLGWLNLGKLFSSGGGGGGKATNTPALRSPDRPKRLSGSTSSIVSSTPDNSLRTTSIPVVAENTYYLQRERMSLSASSASALAAAASAAAAAAQETRDKPAPSSPPLVVEASSPSVPSQPQVSAPAPTPAPALRRQTSLQRTSMRRLTLAPIAEEGAGGLISPGESTLTSAPSLSPSEPAVPAVKHPRVSKLDSAALKMTGLRRRSVMLFGSSEVVGKLLEGGETGVSEESSTAGKPASDDGSGATLERRSSFQPTTMAPIQPRRQDRRRSSLAAAPLSIQADGSLGIDLLAGGKRASLAMPAGPAAANDDGFSLGLLPFSVVTTDKKGGDDYDEDDNASGSALGADEESSDDDEEADKDDGKW